MPWQSQVGKSANIQVHIDDNTRLQAACLWQGSKATNQSQTMKRPEVWLVSRETKREVTRAVKEGHMHTWQRFIACNKVECSGPEQPAVATVSC